MPSRDPPVPNSTKAEGRRLARQIRVELRREGGDTTSIRRVRRIWSRNVRQRSPEVILAIVQDLVRRATHIDRFVAFELLASHKAAFSRLDDTIIESFAADVADWGSVDLLGVTIVGPAWRAGLLSDSAIHSWARSADRWHRRLALVATVPLNARSRGGSGDARRTLAVCRRLITDRDPMVIKAMSWALRELAKREPGVVAAFVERERHRLPALVRREVKNKLETGVKSGRSRGRSRVDLALLHSSPR